MLQSKQRKPCRPMNDKERRKRHNEVWLYRERAKLYQCQGWADVRICFAKAELEAAAQRPLLRRAGILPDKDSH